MHIKFGSSIYYIGRSKEGSLFPSFHAVFGKNWPNNSFSRPRLQFTPSILKILESLFPSIRSNLHNPVLISVHKTSGTRGKTQWAYSSEKWTTEEKEDVGRGNSRETTNNSIGRWSKPEIHENGENRSRVSSMWCSLSKRFCVEIILAALRKEISRSEESLWWLVNLISRKIISRKIIFCA